MFLFEMLRLSLYLNTEFEVSYNVDVSYSHGPAVLFDLKLPPNSEKLKERLLALLGNANNLKINKVMKEKDANLI